MVRTSMNFLKQRSEWPFWLLTSLLIILWIAGGASRADVIGQPVVRFFAWALLIAAIVGLREWKPVRPLAPLVFLLAAIAVCILQLLPLPPELWTALPGRQIIAEAAVVLDQPQPWRPISISPSGTMNALSALVIPFITYLLLSQLPSSRDWRLVTVIVALAGSGVGIGLVQASGVGFDNPFLNDMAGMVSGNFANRNHFALFIAIICLILPAWALHGNKLNRIRLGAALILVPLSILLSLATGSRAGIVLTALALPIGMLVVRAKLRKLLSSYPRNWILGLALLGVLGVVGLVVLSVTLDRAEAVNRAIDLRSVEDLRVQSLPILWDMIIRYFPFGAGFGTFDPAFRIEEPMEFLQPAYFNHAHNDFLEVAIDGGIFGIALLCAAFFWWALRSFRVWLREPDNRLGQIGSALILLVAIGSAVDYPARTPIIMALIMIAAGWLGSKQEAPSSGALPTRPRRV